MNKRQQMKCLSRCIDGFPTIIDTLHERKMYRYYLWKKYHHIRPGMHQLLLAMAEVTWQEHNSDPEWRETFLH